MAKIAIIYGSTTGNTEAAAKKIQTELGAGDLFPADKSALAKAAEYEVLLLGSSTWGFGDLQDDWEDLADGLGSIDFAGKKIGFFGTGDQEGYGDTFVDGMGILYDALAGTGAEFIGAWPTEGYTFSESKAVRGGAFVGLALDEDNQEELSDSRICDWVRLVSGQID